MNESLNMISNSRNKFLNKSFQKISSNKNPDKGRDSNSSTGTRKVPTISSNGESTFKMGSNASNFTNMING